MRRLRLLPAAVAIAAACAVGCPDASPPPPPPPASPAAPRFTAYLTKVGPDAEAVIAAVASIRGTQPRLARKVIERFPGRLPVAVQVDRATAEQAAAALREVGAEASVAEVPGAP